MNKQPNNNLSEVLKQSEGALHTPPETPEPEPTQPVVENGNPRKTPATRQNTKVVMGHFPKDVHTQLQYLRIETDQKNMQELVAEGTESVVRQV